jgi:hypothetical protein
MAGLGKALTGPGERAGANARRPIKGKHRRKVMKAKSQEKTISILKIDQVTLSARILFTSPLIMNRLPKKAREQLLLPPLPKNKAARQQTLKHDPIAEYRDSVYRCPDPKSPGEPKAPTLVHLPNGAFKKAMAQAAIDIPGATKAQIGRLVSISNPMVHLYGIPYLYTAVVRQAGINHAPDIRTRAIFPQAACEISIAFIRQLINEGDLARLLSAAGIITGIGDGRTEKGTFDFGQFVVVDDNTPEHAQWKTIVSKQGRAAQEAALLTPEAYDEDSEELVAYFQAEIGRRDNSRSDAAPTRKKKMRATTAVALDKRGGNAKRVEIQ